MSLNPPLLRGPLSPSSVGRPDCTRATAAWATSSTVLLEYSIAGRQLRHAANPCNALGGTLRYFLRRRRRFPTPAPAAQDTVRPSANIVRAKSYWTLRMDGRGVRFHHGGAKLARWTRRLARVAAGGQAWPTNAANDKTPRRSRRGALGRNPGLGLPVGGEVATIGFLEPGRFPLSADLPKDRTIQSGMWRRAVGARP